MRLAGIRNIFFRYGFPLVHVRGFWSKKRKILQIIKIEKALDLIEIMCYNKILTESIVSMI